MTRTDVPAQAALTARLRAAGCVFAEDEARLLLDEASDAHTLEELVGRRVGGEPLEVVLGWARFAGHRVGIAPGVFVPRMRTELLVDLAAAALRTEHVTGRCVVDLCCGSGAVGLAVARAVPGVELHAADVDPVAVACAAANLRGVGRVHCGDLFGALPRDLAGRIDLVVVNAPYVPSARVALMPPEARDHEPRTALDGGPDGVSVQRRVARHAPRWLAPGGRLLVETSTAQTELTCRTLTDAGLRDVHVRTCPRREATVVVGHR